MRFLADPPYGESGLGGTFLSQDEANAAAHRIFQDMKEDARVLKTERKDDGCLKCVAGHQDPSRGGFMCEVDVNRISWNDQVS